VSWRVVVTETAVEGLSESEKATVTAELFAWVEHGPPRQNRRPLFGAPLFEDRLPSGFKVAYFVDPSIPYVAVVRVRRG
jgi:hypothetical protein